ncbi:lysophosphatidic acid receptor 3 isoform X2 [Neoarius graeffei]|uniref:lysophosphatidic acid receptor 3 isoform X2 n=1 Tax=Neoarius graeffei TaxID=443677 RepID=UPI00298C3C52|nr:lysophosphatidic acid receptor 3 isoform X2 [Neoarius graeffei]
MRTHHYIWPTFCMSYCFILHKMSSQNGCYYNMPMGFFYNRTNNTNENWNSTHLITLQCVGCIVCCFILLSNTMVITAVITNKRFHYAFYYLVANLAASDFLAGIAYIHLLFNTGLVSQTLTVQRYFLRQGLLDTSLSASLANLLVIALERYISVMNWKVHSNLTKRRVTLLIVLVWCVSIFMGAVPILGWNCICSIDQCSVLGPIFSRSYLIFWSAFNLGLFFIMVAIYLKIYIYVMRKTNDLNSHTSASLKRKKTPVKLIKTVMTVLGVFVICWTPGLIVLLLDGLNCDKCHLLKFKHGLVLLAILNSVMNPIVYSYKDDEMWSTIKNLLRCVCNGTRRQRSSKANTRAASSSTEMNTSLRLMDDKNTTQDMLKT